jgi:hypothetical protein
VGRRLYLLRQPPVFVTFVQLRDIRRDPPRLVFGEGIGPSGTRLHSLSFPILRFAADSDLFELANDFSSLS